MGTGGSPVRCMQRGRTCNCACTLHQRCSLSDARLCGGGADARGPGGQHSRGIEGSVFQRVRLSQQAHQHCKQSKSWMTGASAYPARFSVRARHHSRAALAAAVQGWEIAELHCHCRAAPCLPNSAPAASAHPSRSAAGTAARHPPRNGCPCCYPPAPSARRPACVVPPPAGRKREGQ